MAEQSTFETLVLDISAEERRSLLRKLQTATQLSSEALIKHSDEDHGPVDYTDIYSHLGIINRVVIFFKCLIFSMSREDALRALMLKKLVRKIDASAKNLVDTRREVLLEAFMDELHILRHAAKYFYNLLDRTLEKQRTAFFAFLASLELDLVHQQLMLETDPRTALQANPTASETDIRMTVNKAIDNSMVLIGEEQRRSMYHNVHSLFVLKSLSAFQFERLLKLFTSGFTDRREVALSAVASQLRELDAILNELEFPPSMKLMETIFTFYFSDQIEEPGFDIEAAIKEELVVAEQALAEIRAFNKIVPLHLIVKLAMSDPDLQADPIPGGEDWYALFKAYWRDRTDRQYQKWLAEKKMGELQGRMKQVSGDSWAGTFEYLGNTELDSIPPVRFVPVLRCLDSFINTVFLRDINRVLKLILMDGEFYKRDNRLDFTDAYNKLLKIPDTLKKYDEKLGPEGEFGLAYIQARQEVSSLSVKRRKVESAIQAAETEAEAIIRNAMDGINRMHLVLKGVLGGNSRERYDSLSNLSRMDGKANADFIRGVELAKDRFEQLGSLVNDLSKLALMNETMLDVSIGLADAGKLSGAEADSLERL
ncbi:MAG: DUF5312 domain-containing protein [Spirochaetes bacterium]|nr:DUF5312 domain-containing protein [Spirochaetota bacterium]MBU0955042.1 DUF5312 domain-containing protein [Spirochaetota bacterium]